MSKNPATYTGNTINTLYPVLQMTPIVKPSLLCQSFQSCYCRKLNVLYIRSHLTNMFTFLSNSAEMFCDISLVIRLCSAQKKWQILMNKDDHMSYFNIVVWDYAWLSWSLLIPIAFEHHISLGEDTYNSEIMSKLFISLISE